MVELEEPLQTNSGWVGEAGKVVTIPPEEGMVSGVVEVEVEIMAAGLIGQSASERTTSTPPVMEKKC